MLIDWFTVAAQLLNFFVLVWLMKRFLYQPVLGAIAAREASIAGTLATAAAELAAAKALDASVSASSAAFERQRAVLLADAVAAAQTANAALLDQGKNAETQRRAQAAAALEAQHARLATALTLRTRDEVLAAVRKTLADLSDTTLDDQVVCIFLRRLASLDDTARARLVGAAAAADALVEIRSAFPLDASQRAALTNALTAAGASARPCKFTVAPELVCGLECRIGGWCLAWNVDHYMQGISQRSADFLQQGAATMALP